jgi:WD40 repeat protein
MFVNSYSFAISNPTKSNLLFASGTVFGDVLLWKYNFSSDTFDFSKSTESILMKQQNIIEENKFDHPLAETFTLIQSNLFEREDITIFHYLKGCKGAIYDLAFNSSLTSICSASDDRTIRVWDLRNLTEFVYRLF